MKKPVGQLNIWNLRDLMKYSTTRVVFHDFYKNLHILLMEIRHEKST